MVLGRLHRAWWLALSLILGLLLLVLLVSLSYRIPAVQLGSTEVCRQTAELTPRERAGPPWEEHRHWLALSPFSLDSPGPENYLVINQSKRQGFRWAVEWLPDGTLRFFVPTRYAEIANRGWQRDHWILCAGI